MRRWVLATRDDEQLSDLREALGAHQVDVVAFPVLRDANHHDGEAWKKLLPRVAEITTIALTSPRAAAPLVTAARRYGCWEDLSGIPVAAVGEASAAAARVVGLAVAVVGDGGGAALAEKILSAWHEPRLVVHTCGREHRPELADTLRAAGVEVIELPVYAVDLVPASELPHLPHTPPTAVVLSSPRATEGYVEAVGSRFAAIPHLAFGAATAAAATSRGIVNVTVPGSGVDAIAEEICQNC